MSKPRNTTLFEYNNTHPKKSKNGDCVIRAIGIATNKDWLTVYDEMVALGRELLVVPTDIEAFSTYMDEIADREVVIHNKKRTTAKDLARRKDGKTYVVRQAGHIVAVKDGKVQDTWDSSERGSYIIWKLR